jgi:hypothetical protein
MNPMTHYLAGWSVANIATLSSRDRALITISGVIPDLDGLGMIPDWLTRNSANPTDWWGEYHHILGHNIGFALATAVVTSALSRRHAAATVLALASFHLHLAGDAVGARGPDGYQWPIPYLLPFSNAWQLVWSGQWALNGRQNFLITGVLLLLAFYLAWKHGYSPIEMFSSRADAAFVTTLRARFGPPPKPLHQ